MSKVKNFIKPWGPNMSKVKNFIKPWNPNMSKAKNCIKPWDPKLVNTISESSLACVDILRFLEALRYSNFSWAARKNSSSARAACSSSSSVRAA